VFPFLAIGYIGIPIDLINAEISVPAWPIEPMSLDIPPNPEKTHKAALADIISKIEAAKNPIIIVDACALRRNVTKDVQKLIDVSGFPTYVTPMGKGGVDEEQQAYRGCYAGDVSYDEVKQEVIKSDLILEIGGLKSDFNTGGFTYHLDREKIISFHSFNTTVFYATYEKVGKKYFTINMFMNVETSR
jgi:pyruvate decarboxylase